MKFSEQIMIQKTRVSRSLQQIYFLKTTEGVQIDPAAVLRLRAIKINCSANFQGKPSFF